MTAEKYQNKYRVKSTRLQNWDYGWSAAYFVTICTYNKECCLGDISNGEMRLSSVGILADVLWYEIKNHADDVDSGAFVVMPNHIHGILILSGNDENFRPGPGCGSDSVETRHALSLQRPHPQNCLSGEGLIGKNRLRNQGKNTLSSIIGSYKSAVSKHAHRLGFDFKWQSRFYDHVIRDEKSYSELEKYIVNNPMKWHEDKFFAPAPSRDKACLVSTAQSQAIIT